ncbi:uncharacterized protein DNG_00996 [Cephalotrichum gorgonifer]|uniref:25S rRNA (Uridine(2843)-N(3))-methyltransferase n=1 Tax=Cephalotrichum gorgonifer TaxID=2041049 RepID=A0AAE8SRA7_9PEZI|nr:uncharacterized protein DNG_00996 [Cephalotrichum gorgonifer]
MPQNTGAPKKYTTSTKAQNPHRHGKGKIRTPPVVEAPPSFNPPQLTFPTQERLLDVFARTFDDELSGPHLEPTIQKIKGDLFNRDFASAFGTEEHLSVYAARWAPPRALCYSSIFNFLRHQFPSLLPAEAREKVAVVPEGTAQPEDELDQRRRPRVRMMSVGGAAAELTSFAAFLASDPRAPVGEITLVDSGSWASVVDRLQEKLVNPPQLSKYASEAAIAASKPFISPDSLLTTFAQHDVLAVDKDCLARLVGTEPLVVTMLFTLNELYTSGGIGKTTTFLLNLSACLAPGSVLLVVDSPGSYSEAGVGDKSKSYPMQWLLDHTLTKTVPDTWEKLESCDSVWFRLAESLRYPISLENMRYQIHLYRVRGPAKPAAEGQEGS